jgi:D-glycero-alpha-D-manno-heptose-7-phosphate kinase
MIISRTPLRISFAGGGTDLPAFYEKEPGAVISTAINKYIYINVNNKFDRKVRVSYSITEIADRARDVKHELVREALDIVGINGGVEITSISDIPSSGTGLGSSSTYTVGVLNALYAYTGRRAGAERLASEACDIEINRLGKPIGKQDQYIAAYGGLEYTQFNPDGTVSVDPIICETKTKWRLQNRLIMLYTGITRSADGILDEQSHNTKSDENRRLLLRRMKNQADEMRAAIENNNLDTIGELLHEGWEMKRKLASGISNPQIDEWYDIARKHGALGGKVLGAGGGGFLLLYAHQELHDQIIAALPDMKHTPIRFEPQGSKIIFVEE